MLLIKSQNKLNLLLWLLIYLFNKYATVLLDNSNTVIGDKLHLLKENFNINILEHDLKYCLEHVKPEQLSIKKQSLVQCLHKLSLAKCSQKK